MIPTVVTSSEACFTSHRFIVDRMAERAQFPIGQEVVIAFSGQHAFEEYAMARKAAMVYSGILTQSSVVDTFPFVSEIGPYKGRVTGSQSHDGLQGWRIDYSPRTATFHINWWDRRLDHVGNRNRNKHYYGANNVVQGSEYFFWEIESHFPGQIEVTEADMRRARLRSPRSPRTAGP